MKLLRLFHKVEEGVSSRRGMVKPVQHAEDLQGFLQCMAQEGRPMPSDEAVVKLEKILYLKDEETGEYCCPLMKQEHLSEIK